MSYDAIKLKWGKFCNIKFPKLNDFENEGICLISLDSDIAGCILFYIKRKSLDEKRLTILMESDIKLKKVLQKLCMVEKSYFKMLSLITSMVLNEIEDNSQSSLNIQNKTKF